MLSKIELKILSVFRKDLFSRLTFKEIKQKSRQKSNSMVQRAISAFKKQSLIKTELFGDVTVYSLNLENSLTRAYLALCLEDDKGKVPEDARKVLGKMVQQGLECTEFFILFLFGSYAKGEESKKSDLDIAVIVENDDAKIEFRPFVETVKRRELMEIDAHVFTREEFTEMLENNSENLGKQIYRGSLVFHGLEQYIDMLGKIYVKPGRTLLSKGRE
ncbi:MAG: nucleotidyltransferase domain-containing protein [archaeon]